MKYSGEFRDLNGKPKIYKEFESIEDFNIWRDRQKKRPGFEIESHWISEADYEKAGLPAYTDERLVEISEGIYRKEYLVGANAVLIGPEDISEEKLKEEEILLLKIEAQNEISDIEKGKLFVALIRSRLKKNSASTEERTEIENDAFAMGALTYAQMGALESAKEAALAYTPTSYLTAEDVSDGIKLLES